MVEYIATLQEESVLKHGELHPLLNDLDANTAPANLFFYRCLYINRMADSFTTGMLCQMPYLPQNCDLGTANCLLFILAIGWGLNIYESVKMWCDVARARGNGLSQI